MPSINRVCAGCAKTILVTANHTLGPLPTQAIGSGRILCTDCIQRLNPPRHPQAPEMVIWDDEEFSPLANVWCGKAWGNPENSLYDPTKPRVFMDYDD